VPAARSLRAFEPKQDHRALCPGQFYRLP
jgi:hypothetical protein